MKSKNLSENILRSVKSKGYKYIDLPSVIEANHIVQRSGENFRKFIFSFTDQNGSELCLDQNPIDKINKRGIKSKVMPTFKPAKSARIPIISGKTAPPIIPETNIPEKAPWFFDIEFKAREIIIDHIVDIKDPFLTTPFGTCL